MNSSDLGYEAQRAYEKKMAPPPVEFFPMFPSETRGDGNIKKNNIRNGSTQGKGSFLLKVSCRICGFPADANQNDHSGGSLDGNGANFLQSTAIATVTFSNGVSHTENYGTPGIRKGAGCPLCGSKNFTRQRVIITGSAGWNMPRQIGF